jgi:5'-deoxynucleotidase YfbR-like HD superfamily hydrolase
VNAFANADARAAKIEAEAEAIERIGDEFPTFPGMIDAMRAYEAGDDEEVWFVKTVDKMQSLLMDSFDNWRAHSSIGVAYDEFSEFLAGKLALTPPYMQEMFGAVIEYSKETYWHQP